MDLCFQMYETKDVGDTAAPFIDVVMEEITIFGVNVD